MESEGRRYRILELLGTGGFGTVYRAELLGQGGFAKPVAIKLLNGTDASDDVVQRLRDEARMLGLLQHRAVVGVDGLVEFEQGWAVIMELVPGVDAAALVHHGPPPPTIALEIVEEVGAALHAAQEIPSPLTGEKLHLLHRDIKTSNIRVTHQGQVKVLDFGVARAEFGTREAHTRSVLLGSLRYMAPERYDGIESAAGDIYALGIVLAELLTGETFEEPPKHPRRHVAFLADLGERVERMQTHLGTDAAAIGRLCELVRVMVAFEPEDRPVAREIEQRCRALRRELDGPWLKVWGEEAVPRFAAKAPPPEAAGALTGSVLVERGVTSPIPSEAQTLPPSPARTAPTPSTTRTVEIPIPSATWGRTLAVGLAAAAAGAAAIFGFQAVTAPNEEPIRSLDEVMRGAERQVAPTRADDPLAGIPVEDRRTLDELTRSGRMVQKVDSVGGLPQPSSGDYRTDILVSGVASAMLEPNGGERMMAWGPVPPDTYRLLVKWSGGTELVEAGDVRVEDGHRVRIACSADERACTQTIEALPPSDQTKPDIR